ncbi:MAG: NAD(P)/FAD-dependent oxidoreductase [Roseiflexaceae bacterium]
MQHVIVIGAGLAGLAAARELRRAGLRVTVLERQPQPGGRVHTELLDGMPIETGANFLASFYTRTYALLRELGLSGELQPIPGRAAILRDGQLHRMWPNPQVVLTRLLPLRSKLALGGFPASLLRSHSQLDVHAFHKAHALDTCSVAEYARRELNEEVLEYLLQPPLSGIFYWTPERTSVAMLFVALRAALSLHGVQLETLRCGLGALPHALAEGLDVWPDTPVERVTREQDGRFVVNARVGGAVRLLPADAVVCATTASAVPWLFPQLTARQRAFFEAVRYAPNVAAAVSLGRRLPAHFYGLLLPRRESDTLAAVTVQSAKLPADTPAGRDGLVVHASGPASAGLLALDDAGIRAALLAELRHTVPRYDPAGDERTTRVYRWPEAVPEFDVGHFQRLRQFAEGGIEPPGLVFAGDYLGGPFVEGAITSGQQAAGRLIQAL